MGKVAFGKMRKKKEVFQCVRCGSFKSLSEGEVVVYTKDRNLKIVTVCDNYCKKAFVEKEINELKDKIKWLKAEVEG